MNEEDLIQDLKSMLESKTYSKLHQAVSDLINELEEDTMKPKEKDTKERKMQLLYIKVNKYIKSKLKTTDSFMGDEYIEISGKKHKIRVEYSDQWDTHPEPNVIHIWTGRFQESHCGIPNILKPLMNIYIDRIVLFKKDFTKFTERLAKEMEIETIYRNWSEL